MKAKRVRPPRLVKPIGEDHHGRKVYTDQSGGVWKDVSMGVGEEVLYYVLPNSFDGEPMFPIRGKWEVDNRMSNGRNFHSSTLRTPDATNVLCVAG